MVQVQCFGGYDSFCGAQVSWKRQHCYRKAEPLQTVQVHRADTNLFRLSVRISYNNCPGTDVGESDLNSLRKARNILSVYKDFGNLVGIPVGTHRDWNCKFLVKFERSKANISHIHTLYSEFWIRNRSDVQECENERRISEQCARNFPSQSPSWRPSTQIHCI